MTLALFDVDALHPTEPDTAPPPKVVLSYGLGVDSSAILARWLLEPASRDFELDELLVITAMTGNEWTDTIELVQRHMLPLLARWGIRYLQVARRGAVQAAGVDVLADSRRPTRLEPVGRYTLADELFAAGTVPQVAGERKCSLHFKGWPLDQVIRHVTRGGSYRHAMGYETREQRRADRDAAYNTATRTGFYPLIEWGWDRVGAVLGQLVTSRSEACHSDSGCMLPTPQVIV